MISLMRCYNKDTWADVVRLISSLTDSDTLSLIYNYQVLSMTQASNTLEWTKKNIKKISLNLGRKHSFSYFEYSSPKFLWWLKKSMLFYHWYLIYNFILWCFASIMLLKWSKYALSFKQLLKSFWSMVESSRALEFGRSAI